jgi:hypothetical protein
MVNRSVIYSKNAVEFITVGKEFMAFCESKTEGGREGFSETSLKLISLLYLKALSLPVIEPQESESFEKYITEEAWAFVKFTIESKLEEWDDIVDIRDAATMNNTDFINVSISELYADIYQDIGDLLGSYQMGDESAMYDALYVCKDNFLNYWGIRAIKILETLHYRLYTETEKDENGLS